MRQARASQVSGGTNARSERSSARHRFHHRRARHDGAASTAPQSTSRPPSPPRPPLPSVDRGIGEHVQINIQAAHLNFAVRAYEAFPKPCCPEKERYLSHLAKHKGRSIAIVLTIVGAEKR